jgi:T5SS/PEP-CTERM-associated repeat protein
VIFGLNRSYTVDLAGNAASGTLLLTNGSRVTMGGGSFTVTGNAAAEPSFIVTREAQLSLSGPTMVLNAQDSLLGNDASRWVKSSVSDGARWNNNGRLIVGQRGEGSLIISNGGAMQTQETIIGDGRERGSVIVSGEGSLWDSGDLSLVSSVLGPWKSGQVVRPTAPVRSSARSVPNRLDNGRVLVEGVSGNGAASTWLVTGLLRVGGSGIGTLAVNDGAIVECDDLRLGAVGGGIGLCAVVGFRR